MPSTPLARTTLILFLSALACLVTASSAFAVGGPVILGGDDLTDHGSVNGANESQQGWLYIEKSVGNIKSQVARSNDNTIAAFGSSASASTSGDAGAAIGNAAAKNGMTVQYFDGPAAMDAGFASIANGGYRPAIIWVAGDGASNNIDNGCSGAGSEGQSLIDNSAVINNFVSDGGGLLSHGSCYEWLSALLPGLATPQGGNSGDLFKTPEGNAAFPAVTEADFNAGPWHNHFEGNFGGLNLLVRSNRIKDSSGQDAAVVIGGAQVTLTSQPPAAPVVPAPLAAAQVPVDPCQRRAISLVRADTRGSNVVLAGLVLRRLANQPITLFRGTTKGGFKRLATVRANPAGQFTAKVARPNGKALSLARFRAQVGNSRSVALKVPQSLKSNSAKKTGRQVEVRGSIKRSVLGKRNAVVVKRLICGRYRTVGKATPDANGRYVVRFNVSNKGSVALFRAESMVLRKPGSRTYVKQYARAVAIAVTDTTG